MLSMRPTVPPKPPVSVLPHLPPPVILQGQLPHADELRRRRRRQDGGYSPDLAGRTRSRKKAGLPALPVYQPTAQPGRVCQISLGAPPRHLTFWHWHWKDGQPVKAIADGAVAFTSSALTVMQQHSSEPNLHLPALVRASDEVNAPNGGAATVPHAAVSSSAPALPELPSPTDLTASPRLRKTRGKKLAPLTVGANAFQPKDAAELVQEARQNARRKASLRAAEREREKARAAAAGESPPGAGMSRSTRLKPLEQDSVPAKHSGGASKARSDLPKHGKQLQADSAQAPRSGQEPGKEGPQVGPASPPSGSDSGQQLTEEDLDVAVEHRPSVVWGQQVLAGLSKSEKRKDSKDDWSAEGIKQRLRRQSLAAAAAEPEIRRRLSAAAREPAAKRVEAYLEDQKDKMSTDEYEVERLGRTTASGPWTVEVRILAETLPEAAAEEVVADDSRSKELAPIRQSSHLRRDVEKADPESPAVEEDSTDSKKANGAETVHGGSSDQMAATLRDTQGSLSFSDTNRSPWPELQSFAGSHFNDLQESTGSLVSPVQENSPRGPPDNSRSGLERFQTDESDLLQVAQAHGDAAWHANLTTPYKSVLPYDTVDDQALEKAFHKHRVEATMEMLVELIPTSLKYAGYRELRKELLDEIVEEKVGQGSFVYLKEYWEVVHAYNERRLDELHEEFKAADEHSLGFLDIQATTGTLQSNGVQATPCIVKELLTEIHNCDTVRASTYDYVQLRGIFQYRGGFTAEQAEDARTLFSRYDDDGSGRMDTEELERAMKWLGLHLQEDDHGPKLDQLLQGIEMLESGLAFEDFLQVLRHHREAEIQWARKLYTEKSSEGPIDAEAAHVLLVKIGFTSSTSELVEETATECGVDQLSNISFDDFYLVLRLIRGREGFSPKEVEEFREAYVAHDTNDSKSVDVVELGGALRWCGYPCTIEEQQDFMDDVDIDKSGEIDFDEFLKIMRWYKEKEFQQLEKAFEEGDVDNSGTLNKKEIKKLLPNLGFYHMTQEQKDLVEKWSGSGEINFTTCRHMIQALRNINCNDFREKHGFLEKELLRLRHEFERVDADKSGEIAKHELAHLLEECVPESSKTLEGREYAKSLIETVDRDGDGSLNWREFLHLMRLVQDRADYDAVLKEQEAARKAGFSQDEVKDLRKAFKLCDSDASRSLDVDEVIKMLTMLVPMSRKVQDEVRDIVQAQDEDGTNTLDFAEFLAVMRKVQDENIVELRPSA